MMQLGFHSAILSELDFEGVLATASEIGFDCVEVMCWPPGKASRRYAGVSHLDAASLVREGRYSESEVERIHSLCEKYGVTISGLGYYPNALSPNVEEAEAAVEHIRTVISAASRLGLDRFNTFIGRDWTRSVEDNWPAFLATWKPILAHAESEGVVVGIENCPMSFTADEWPGGKNLAHSPAIWRRMFAAIPSASFGLNYDPSHMVLQQMDYLRPMTDFSDKLFHIHAKDIRIDRDRLNEVGILAHPNDYHSPKLPGLGEIDWGRFFSVLTDTGYRGAVCVEVEDRAFEGSLADRKTALRQSHHFLRGLIG